MNERKKFMWASFHRNPPVPIGGPVALYPMTGIRSPPHPERPRPAPRLLR